MNTAGTLFARFSLSDNLVDTSTPWAAIYSSLNKPSADDLGVVPDTRTVNGKRLNADITVTSEDIGTYTK